MLRQNIFSKPETAIAVIGSFEEKDRIEALNRLLTKNELIVLLKQLGKDYLRFLALFDDEKTFELAIKPLAENLNEVITDVIQFLKLLGTTHPHNWVHILKQLRPHLTQLLPKELFTVIQNEFDLVELELDDHQKVFLQELESTLTEVKSLKEILKLFNSCDSDIDYAQILYEVYKNKILDFMQSRDDFFEFLSSVPTPIQERMIDSMGPSIRKFLPTLTDLFSFSLNYSSPTRTYNLLSDHLTDYMQSVDDFFLLYNYFDDLRLDFASFRPKLISLVNHSDRASDFTTSLWKLEDVNERCKLIEGAKDFIHQYCKTTEKLFELIKPSPVYAFVIIAHVKDKLNELIPSEKEYKELRSLLPMHSQKWIDNQIGEHLTWLMASKAKEDKDYVLTRSSSGMFASQYAPAAPTTAARPNLLDYPEVESGGAGHVTPS